MLSSYDDRSIFAFGKIAAKLRNSFKNVSNYFFEIKILVDIFNMLYIFGFELLAGDSGDRGRQDGNLFNNTKVNLILVLNEEPCGNYK